MTDHALIENLYEQLSVQYAEHEYVVQTIKNGIKEIIMDYFNQDDIIYEIVVKDAVIILYIKSSIPNSFINQLINYIGIDCDIQAVNRNGKKLWLELTFGG